MGNQCKYISYHENSNIELKIERTNSPQNRLKELDNLKQKIKKLGIFERPKIARNKLKEFLEKQKKHNIKNINLEQIKQEYIDINEILLLNDTDKDIVSQYLQFIDQYNEFIKAYKFKSFSQELSKYSKLFTITEMNKKKYNYKLKSEKDKFIDYLTILSNSKDYQSIGKDAEKNIKNIYYFNYPIEFSNQELFYYKLYFLLIKEIANVYVKYPLLFSGFIEERIKIAKFVINNKILENAKIVNNEDKMNMLIILILFDELNDEGESINFNRLLQTEKASFSDLEKYVKQYELGELCYYDSKNVILKNINNNPLKIKKINLDTICIKNLRSSIGKKIEDNSFYEFTFDTLLVNNEISLYIENIKLFLFKFIHSNVYKEAIIKLFPKHFTNLLDTNLKDLEIYIKNRLKFYPYQDLYNSGLTDKISFYSYIPIIFPLNYNEDYEPIYPIFKTSGTIENTIHEINHINQDILFFKENDISFFNTPKREGFKTGIEGGENIEELLFGRKITRLGLLESLYILNEKNFDQSLFNYKKNFMEIYSYTIPFEEKKKYLEISETGIFRNLCNNIDKYIKKATKGRDIYSMNTKNRNLEMGDNEFNIYRGRCVLPA